MFIKTAILALIIIAAVAFILAFCLAPISLVNLALLSGGVAAFEGAERLYKARLATGK